MKNKKFFLIIISILLLLSILFLLIFWYKNEKKANKMEIVLADDLTVEFATKKKVSEFIININGKIIDDEIVDTTKLGKKKVSFNFINDSGRKKRYSFEILVVDTKEPLIWLGEHYSVEKGKDIDLTKKILCGDIYDSNPVCTVEGEYNLNEVGNYNLIFKGIDSSGNEAVQKFTLHVTEPKTDKNNSVPTYISFQDVIDNYKTDTTKIGIDVSKWQNKIDFKKLKEAGVEFVMIKIGGTLGEDGEYYLDPNFITNIEEANKYDIPVGVYFYSYASSKESAIRDAKWVIDNIKDYKVDLPIALDWEEWRYFNEFNLSFFELTSVADAFLKTVEESSYKGILYSSKNYLEKVWLPLDYDIWLAHYTSETNYEGDYLMWQLCDNGLVDGINGAVDINIMYQK